MNSKTLLWIVSVKRLFGWRFLRFKCQHDIRHFTIALDHLPATVIFCYGFSFPPETAFLVMASGCPHATAIFSYGFRLPTSNRHFLLWLQVAYQQPPFLAMASDCLPATAFFSYGFRLPTSNRLFSYGFRLPTSNRHWPFLSSNLWLIFWFKKLILFDYHLCIHVMELIYVAEPALDDCFSYFI